MKKIFLFVLFAGSLYAEHKPLPVQHVEPSFWWIGMKNTQVQVLFHNTDIDMNKFDVTLKYDGVALQETKRLDNPHYLFLTLSISPDAQPGKVPLVFTRGKKSLIHYYELRSKPVEKNVAQGFNSADVLYLIMPDRFANGDPSNDSIPGMFETTRRNMPYGRHGGDLKGIANHLDYLTDLGITTLWLNPVLENNQRGSSYHGYAITDLYNVDRRFGSNDQYVQLIKDCHTQGLKVIQDMVMNHIGNEHWLMHDLPSSDWVHQFPDFTRSNYKAEIISDPYHAKSEELIMSNGWFDRTMPDVNQQNQLFATYLIQNTIWWIQYAGIDGIRMDTYPYPDKEFMARWANAVTTEFPSFKIVGEVWMRNVNTVAYWQRGANNKDGYQSGLRSVTDFPLYYAMIQALKEQGNWNTGMSRLYDILSQDFAYPDANANVTFLDNHDLGRYYTAVEKDLNKFKMGLVFLLTTRGIPQLYYGTELLMEGDENNHASLRKDFPGGWKNDSVNAFTKAGRTNEQNESYDFLRTLLHWRKQNPVIHTGKLVHYTVQDNVYVYFRYNAEKTVMVVLNGNAKETVLNTSRFAEHIRGAKKAIEVINNQDIGDMTHLTIPGQHALILELR